jgi:CBS domain containing-hemolysin-like protein
LGEPSIAGLLVAASALLILRTVLGVADSNLVLLSRSKLRQMAEDGHRGSQRLDELLEDRHRLHASLAVCRTSMSVLLGAITVWISREFVGHISPQVAIVAVAILFVLFFEIMARRLAWLNPERLGSNMVWFYVLVHRAALPFVTVLSALTSFVTRLAGSVPPSERHVTEDDIRLLVEAGQDLEEREKEMIHSIFELSDTLAREVMVPRVDMVAVEVATSLARVLEISLEHGLSRLPVYEGTVDNVIGVLSTKDLLALMKDGKMDNTTLRELLRPAYFVPASKKVDELLREMQRDKVAMAIVVDEYGGTDGLITMEDLIEEIVGEITDEYDKDTQAIELLKDGSVTIDAKTIIEDVNAALELDLPVDDYETIGGYVYGLLGHVPREGENTEVDGVVINVEQVQRQRITKVRLSHKDGTAFELPEQLQTQAKRLDEHASARAAARVR